MINELAVLPLTRQAFARFGEVIEIDGAEHFSINRGSAERYFNLANVDVGDENGWPLISIVRGQPFSPPVEIILLERHPLGSQIFMPLNNRPFLVVVAEADENGMPIEPEAFVARGDQGINFAKNTWHGPLIALEAQSDFFVVDRQGPGNNLEEHFFTDGPYVVAGLS